MIGGALLLAFVVFALSNRLSEVVRSAFAGDTPFDAIPEEWWNRLSSDPFTLSMDKPDLIAGGVVVALIGLIVLYQSTKRRNTRPGEEHGSARWAKPKEFAPFTDKDPARRLQLTATEGLSIDSHKTQRNNNVLVLGASGSG
ncbi:type IV secretory system conjugative DNA transfer family protein, partial [Burkholderia multivorans]